MDRIDKLEMIVNRLMRRSNKVAKALVTPFPISNCVEGSNVNGTVLRYMFPSKGMISRGGIFLDSKPKDGVEATLSVSDSIEGFSRSYNILKQSMVLELDIDVRPWNKLDISIRPIGETIVERVWVSFLWSPDVKEVNIKNFLIEELEAQIDDQKKEFDKEMS